MAALPRFLLFYAALFAGFGAASPFLPGLLAERGLSPFLLGAALAAGTAIRLLTGPLGGRLADRSGRAPLVLAGFTAVAAVLGCGYAFAPGVALLMAVGVGHAAVLAPITPVADALSTAASRRDGFRYGWVRGAGSAAFVVGTLVAGQLVGRHGSGIIVWLNVACLAAAAALATALPCVAASRPAAGPAPARAGWRGLREPAFIRMLLVAGLVGGSHAMHDAFEVIRWRAAGRSAPQASFLWALSVGAEVLVFVVVGPWLLPRLGPGRAMMLAAVAGMVRWGTVALTAAFAAMALVEPLHGLTFALLHLACMAVIGQTVPAELAATAQALYATVAVGATTAMVTLASGPLYGAFGAPAFWAMALLCAAALPVAAGLARAMPRDAAAGPALSG